jgi:hypothetical protein
MTYQRLASSQPLIFYLFFILKLKNHRLAESQSMGRYELNIFL